MQKPLSRADNFVIILALFVLCCAMTGCIESSFKLARESRLPKWFTVPPGLTRADVSVTMNYYTARPSGDAKFILKDKNGRTLAKVNGKCRDLNPKQSARTYPAYEVITVNGITEIIEHKKMEPIFYVSTDDADDAVRKELLEKSKVK